MRRGRSAAAAVVLMAIAAVSRPAAAHRLDEYLQAARISVEPGRIDLALDLTPGTAVAEAVIAEIDRDRNGVLSAAEQRACVRAILDAVVIDVDGQTLRVQRLASAFASPEAFRGGDGTIHVESAALLPQLGNGAHRLSFQNNYRGGNAAYLANALVPRSERVAITAQQRDRDQRRLVIDFVLTGQPARPSRLTAAAIAGVLGVAGVAAYRRGRPYPFV